MKNIVQTYFPTIYNRIDNEKFALCDENGFLQIARSYFKNDEGT
jgi:hypothetical protein